MSMKKSMKKMKKFLSGLAVFLVLLTGCPNTVEEPLPPKLNYADKPEYAVDLTGKSIKFTDALLSGDSIAAGMEAGTISLPATGGPWTVVFDGPDSADNAKFDIEYAYAEEDTDRTTPIKATLVVKAGVTLDWGYYSVRVKISNGDAVYKKVFAFEVTLAPAPFKEAPRMYPYVVEGTKKNKMVIKWEKRPGVTTYTVYVGDSDDFGAATTHKLADVPGTASKMEAEMTVFPPPPETGGEDLPDGEKYWAWVTATNALGTSPPSPAAWKKTNSPMQAYFYENIDDNGDEQDEASYFGGSGDFYRFTPTTVKYWMGVGGFNYIGEILYNEVFDPPSPESNFPFPNTLKNGASCLGLPAGVFVMKHPDNRVPPALTSYDTTPGKMKRYSAVYYWGVGARHSSGRVYAGIVNQWGGYAETVTYEEAIDKFTAAAVGKFVHLTPEPYYKEFSDDMSAGPHYEPWINEGAYHPPVP